MTATREDGRALNELRPITITRGWSRNAEGSALIEFGNTRVLCTASFTQAGYVLHSIYCDLRAPLAFLWVNNKQLRPCGQHPAVCLALQFQMLTFLTCAVAAPRRSQWQQQPEPGAAQTAAQGDRGA